uniref:Uncharacterized protein n=1 Tax=Guillardia theta TaxID=55529 RepID=A0A7S4KZJ1_GUITH|mmetsp:Transcript_34408/g.107906  ORF Transcript_34408/g.107906 Transcript_34408/m.107906 type:complete len:286 (+) Transcript_34408:83-940(+)
MSSSRARYVRLPFQCDAGEFRRRHPELADLPRALVTDPKQLRHGTPHPAAVMLYSSYSSFWGLISRRDATYPLGRLCDVADDHASRVLGHREYRLMGCMMRALLSPTRLIEERMMNAIAGARHVVAAHLRVGPLHTSNYVMMTDKDLHTAWGCIDELLATRDGTVLYLATDLEQVRVLARSKYGERVVQQEGPVAHTGEQHAARGASAVDAQGRPRGEDGVETAMLDWWMLGRAQDAVLTDMSSFGYSATARSLFNTTMPITIKKNSEKCHRTVWQGHVCGNETC